MKGSLSYLLKDNQWVKLGDSLLWDEFDKLWGVSINYKWQQIF